MWFNKDSKIVVMQNPPHAGNNMYFTTEENYANLGTKKFNPKLTEAIPYSDDIETFGIIKEFLINVYGFKDKNIKNKTVLLDVSKNKNN